MFEWIYRMLLRLSPREFRRRYGPETVEVAAARVRAEASPMGRSRRAVRECVDLIQLAWRARHPPSANTHRTLPVGDVLVHDIRAALRQARAHAWPTLLVVVTLAFGIGATTAIFSVADAVVWQPLPFADPDRIVLVRGTQEGRPLAALSAPELGDLRDQTTQFIGVGGMWETNGMLAAGGEVEAVHLAWVTSSFFPLLGIDPVVGRHFTAEEDAMRGPRSILLSYELWQRRFRGDPEVIGQTVALDDQQRTVVGVMPPRVRHYEGNITLGWNAFDAWIPNADWPNRGMRFLRTVGRLRPGASLDAANAELAAIGESWADGTTGATGKVRLFAGPLGDALLGRSRVALTALLGAVACVLLVACSNAGSVLRTRALARRREIAVRMALGASRVRVVRMLLTESVLLAGAAGILGLGLARLAVDALARLGPTDVPRFDEIALNPKAAGFGLVITAATGLLFGLAPAWQVRALRVFDAVRGGSATDGPARRRALAVVTAGSVATAVALLIGAGLMARTWQSFLEVDTGFDRHDALTFRASLSPAALFMQGQASGERNMGALAVTVYRELRDRVRELPGVVAVGAAQLLPLGEGQQSGPYEAITDTGAPIDGSADYRVVLPGFFDAVGARLLAGRVLDDRDLESGRRVVVIDQRLADQVWPGRDPIGRSLRLATDSNNTRVQDAEVVGVVASLRSHTLREPGLAQVYLPYGQYADRTLDMHIVVRTTGDPLAPLPAIRTIFGELSPTRPLANVRTLDDYFQAEFSDVRFAVFSMTAFAVATALVAITGLYGVLSLGVAQRSREISCRLMLGAARRDVVRLILRQGLGLGAAGLVAGLLVGVAASRLLTGFLFGVTGLDPVTYVGVTLLVGPTVIAASLVPALRAASLNPMQILRSE